jgi:hypothetical protein
MTSPLAVKAMAASTERVLGNPRRVDIIISRNAALRPRVAPPTVGRQRSRMPSRGAPYGPRRPMSGSTSRPMIYRRIAG